MGATDPGPPLVVCDAGPLIHLDEMGVLARSTLHLKPSLLAAVVFEVERGS